MNSIPLPRPPRAFLLDFDGVILDSAVMKTNAFVKVYEGEDPQRLAEVLEYSALHGGVTRSEKFAHFERSVFQREGEPDEVARLTRAYRDIVYGAVLRSPFIPGAEQFLDTVLQRGIPMHLVSGTPHEELLDIVARRGFGKYFATVHGAPPSKLETFASIIGGRYEPARVLAVGDSLTEFVAATELDIPFLGIVAHGLTNPFPSRITVVPTLEGAAAMLGIE